MSDLWLDEAKRLPLGGKSYTHCPACNTDKKLGIYHDRDAYRASCHKCHWRGYEKRGQLSFAELQKYRRNERKFEQGGVAVPPLKGDIPPHARFWFLKAGIDVELAQEYGIGYSESMDRVILPVYTNGVLEAVQARALRKDQVPKYLNSRTPAGGALFQSKPELHSPDFPYDTTTLVLTEDILSAIRVGRVVDAWALLGTSIDDIQISRIIQAGYSHVLLWLDGDAAGIAGRRKIKRRLLAAGVNAGIVHTADDPKAYTNKEIYDAVYTQTHPDAE